MENDTEDEDAAGDGETPNAKPGRLRANKNSVLAHLIAIAEGEKTKDKERIGALAEIARIKGMVTKRVESSLTVRGSVMLVPFCSSEEQWVALARTQQERLKAEATAPPPTPLE